MSVIMIDGDDGDVRTWRSLSSLRLDPMHGRRDDKRDIVET